jgi:hypothetical protein
MPHVSPKARAKNGPSVLKLIAGRVVLVVFIELLLRLARNDERCGRATGYHFYFVDLLSPRKG